MKVNNYSLLFSVFCFFVILLLTGCGQKCQEGEIIFNGMCCNDTNINSICDSAENTLQELFNANINHFDEQVTHINLIIQHSEGKLKQTFQTKKEEMKNLNLQLQNLISKIDSKCNSIPIKGRNILKIDCEVIKNNLLETNHRIYFNNHWILENYKLISINNDSIEIELNIKKNTFLGDKKLNGNIIMRKNEGENWIILTDEKPLLWGLVDIPFDNDLLIGTTFSDFDNSLKSTVDKSLSYYDSAYLEYLNDISDEAVKLDNDKCMFDTTGMTVTEINERQNTCYTSKYLNYASLKKDESICDTIYRPYWLGACYGKVAFSINNHEICRSVQHIEYTAKGYFEDLSSTDVCYYLFVYETYFDSYSDLLLGNTKNIHVCKFIENEQFEQECIKYEDFLNGNSV
jgi:hypothetical protein